jgi:tetratricopeptide (TPR) repeat protein
MKRVTLILVLAVSISACNLPNPYAPPTNPQRVPGGAPSLPPSPAPQEPVEQQPTPEPAPEEPSTPPPREHQLSSASHALVDQAHAQMASGNYAVAAGSIERALRIEPNNPLLWIELGKVRQAEGNFAQAENLGRKAVSLGTGDPRAQSAAWRLIADSLWARGRTPQALDAEARADALVPR